MDPEPPNLEYFIFQTVVPTSSVDILFPLVLFILLLICSGLVSASEVAYFSLGLKDVKSLEEENTDSSNRALQLKQKPRNLLATILIANNFVNIAIVIVADQILKILLGQDNLLLIGHWL
ncbi:MAG TPA: DUF21 domain-containing protein, partial [Saprospiraceae bacterium]|nr:DUF21 domain-containing protein [Saprospiraceae bacterium]